ncbi:DUF805 domain-containing protein [Pseudarthrobacter sp. J1738]|uniref:DUF805 domain-containing protein n=1 Tax=unclassified Pseudarthrobacter TaxID=2647000 RepID=UPI003D2D9D67
MSYSQPYNTVPTPGETPLWAPLYGANIKVAVQRVFKKYATFSGRASLSEYWWWILVNFLVVLVLYIAMIIGAVATATPSASGYGTNPGPGGLVGGLLLLLWALAVVVPSLAVQARRLHDANYSGWLILLGFVPFLGAIAVIILTAMPSNPAGQRFDEPGYQAGPGYPAPNYGQPTS